MAKEPTSGSQQSAAAKLKYAAATVHTYESFGRAVVAAQERKSRIDSRDDAASRAISGVSSPHDSNSLNRATTLTSIAAFYGCAAPCH